MRLVASVKATTGDVVLHVHGSADVSVEGFPSSEHGDHRFEPAQVTRPTQVMSVLPRRGMAVRTFSADMGWRCLLTGKPWLVRTAVV